MHALGLKAEIHLSCTIWTAAKVIAEQAYSTAHGSSVQLRISFYHIILADFTDRKVEIGLMVWKLNVGFFSFAGAAEKHGSQGFSAPRPASSAQSNGYPAGDQLNAAGDQLNTAMTRLIQASSPLELWPACWESSEHSHDKIGPKSLHLTLCILNVGFFAGTIMKPTCSC